MHLLLGWTGSRPDAGRIREIRLAPSGGGQAAALRRDVLDEVAARRRRRDHRADLQGARAEARLRLRRLGLEDGVPRDGGDLIGLAAPKKTVGEDGFVKQAFKSIRAL